MCLCSGFGPLGAGASYYLMETQDGVWTITDEWMLWVSPRAVGED